MTSVFQPPPTYAEVVIVDPEERQPPRFNPIWLKWFLDLSRNLSSAGAGNVVGPASSLSNEIALFSGTSGLVLTGLGSLGTTVTVLHGNAAGAPTFGAVSLTADVTGTLPITSGGTGRTTGTTAYALVATGTTATGVQQSLAAGAITEILVGGGAAALPVWTTATGSDAPVRATSPTLVTPILGVATATSLQGIIGNVTPAAGAFTTISATGQITSTLATGTAPLVIASTTKVTNLNVDSLDDQSGAYYLDAANFTGFYSRIAARVAMRI